MYIQQIKINEDYNCLKSGLVIDAKPITLLVGDQGSGKSSLLTLLSQLSNKNTKAVELILNDDATKNGVETFYFDTEKNNPRLKDPNQYSTPGGKDKGIGYQAAIMSRFRSHGEVLKEFTVEPIKRAKNCIVILDEPESALSIRNQYKLVKNILETSTNNNVQFLIATHCLPLIEAIETVYSMEHLTWMDSKEFIRRQKEE